MELSFLNLSTVEVLKKFGMDTTKEASTPMGTSCYLDKDES